MVKPNMADLFKQAQKMQEDLARAQEALGNLIVEGSAGGGAVIVTATGKQQIRSVKIDPEVVKSDDVEMLEDLILVAVNQALDKSQEAAKEELQKVGGGMMGNFLSGDLKLPGFGL
ncbi:MAG TPA: YbaB/EbfC family nucleoid-associated protein [bacterium]